MLRVYPLILIFLFLFPGSPALAADTHTAPQTRAVPTSSQQDLEAIITMAGQGDASSQNYLGFLYATGQNVPKDEKVAFTWFQKAADQGHPEALGNLAMMYEKGLGVAKNQLTALSLHRQAATAGYPISMKRLASLYETGFEGEERDPVKAEMWKTRYKETLKGGVPAIVDTDTRQAAEKTLATPAEKPAAPKLAAPPVEKLAAPKLATPPVEKYVTPAVEKPVAPKLATPPVEKTVAPKLATPPVEKPATPKIAAPPIEKPATPKLAAAPVEKPAAPKLAAPSVEKPAAPKLAAPSVEKPAAPKLAAPSVNTPPQAAAPLSGDKESKPALSSANRAGAIATPYFIQVSAKATARETMEIIQKIVDRRLLPPNKNIELINPDGKNYRINIGPFADANQAAPYQSQIMALLGNTPLAAQVKPEPAAAGVPQPLTTPPKAPPPATPTPVSAPVAPAAPAAAKHDEKPVAPPAIAALPPPTKPSAPSAESHDKEKLHYVEVSGKATAQEATELIQKIVETGILPKNMRVEFVSPDTDNYRIRIGPFYDAKDVTPQIAKSNTPVKSAVPQAVAQKSANLELVPATPSPKPAAPVTPAVQEIASPKAASAVAPKVAPAPAAVDTSAAHAEAKHSTAKAARGHYYFILLNAKSSFEDCMFFTQTLLKKELVDITHRVKIENMDGQNFRVSIGPFGNANEANRQAKIINQQAFLKSSIMVFEKFATASGATELQPILQLNAKGDMDNAVTLTKALMEKGLLQQQMFAEIVNFGTGNYRVRYGPFKGAKDAVLDTLNLKKHLKVSPILVNLERLAPLD